MAFLPTTVKEARQRGWDSVDVVLFTGDAYIDHPAFGAAVIGRLLEAEGYRVAVVPQPNWRDDLRDFRKFGTPRLFFAVTAGAMDSMVNHYTANKRLRSNDAYTPGGAAGFRPDYAVETYTRILKRLYPRTPVVVGGIEASLRRLTHYDYWQDALKPSILVDSGADLLIYGMGERVVQQVAAAMRNGYNAKLLRKLRQVAFLADRTYVDRLEDRLLLHSYEECTADPHAFAENFRRIETESNLMEPHSVLVEPTGDRYVVVNPANATLSTEELDRSFDLPYERAPHPRYRGKGDIPAWEMIKHSVNIHRGCFGGCAFCTISAHQGKYIHSRSERSILDEVRRIAAMPDFRGYLSDIGAPSANMYRMGGRDRTLCARCRRPSCLHPRICPNLDNDHRPLLDLYAKIRAVKGIKKAFIGSGIRYDLFDGSDYLETVVRHHTAQSRSRAHRGAGARADAQTALRPFRAAQRRLPLDLPQQRAQLPADPLLHLVAPGLHRTRHAGAGRQGAGPAAFHARTGAGPDPHADDALVGDVLHGRESLYGRKGLRGTLAGGETPSEGVFFPDGGVRRTTAAGTADDSPERRRPRLRHRETRRPTQCAPARKEPQEIKYRSAAPPRKSIRAIAGRRQKAHAHRRIPTATIVPPQLVRRSAPLQPDQIGRCRSTVSRRCSLSRCV